MSTEQALSHNIQHARSEAAEGDPTVVSADGTNIAFERAGGGPPVILVSSALADRSDTKKLAGLLANDLTVFNYDRRARGASEPGGPYSVEREIEDIAALVDAAGGRASLFGSSSGAVLALRAAAAGLDIDRLVVFEPPFVVAPGDFGPPRDLGQRVEALLAEDRRSDVVKYFMSEALGMPGFAVTMMRFIPGVWSNLRGLAPTVPHDIAVMGDTQQGRPLAADPWSSVTVPTLVLTGAKSPEGFHEAARALTGILPKGEHRVLDGLNHGAVAMAPKKLAPQVLGFLT
jgi:pimeloyl-ACP methyl ester carboxylesterase